jgi:hypothetical protein
MATPTIEIRDDILFVAIKQGCQTGIFESSVDIGPGRYRLINEANQVSLRRELMIWMKMVYRDVEHCEVALDRILTAAGLGKDDK